MCCMAAADGRMQTACALTLRLCCSCRRASSSGVTSALPCLSFFRRRGLRWCTLGFLLLPSSDMVPVDYEAIAPLGYDPPHGYQQTRLGLELSNGINRCTKKVENVCATLQRVCGTQDGVAPQQCSLISDAVTGRANGDGAGGIRVTQTMITTHGCSCRNLQVVTCTVLL